MSPIRSCFSCSLSSSLLLSFASPEFTPSGRRASLLLDHQLHSFISTPPLLHSLAPPPSGLLRLHASDSRSAPAPARPLAWFRKLGRLPFPLADSSAFNFFTSPPSPPGWCLSSSLTSSVAWSTHPRPLSRSLRFLPHLPRDQLAHYPN